MDLCEIKRLGGEIIFDDISKLDQAEDIMLVLDDLKEDLFQVSFPFDQLIDIGWYPEFSENGCFRVVLLSGCNWVAPVYSEKATSWGGLEDALANVLKRVKL
jgi:hypothetical protein